MIQNMLFTIMQWSLYSGLPGWRHRVPASNKVFVQTILGKKKDNESISKMFSCFRACGMSGTDYQFTLTRTCMSSSEMLKSNTFPFSTILFSLTDFGMHTVPRCRHHRINNWAVDLLYLDTDMDGICNSKHTWPCFGVCMACNTLPFCHFNQQWILQLLSFGQWRVGLYHNTLLLTVGHTFIPCEVRVQLNLVHCRKLTLN